MWISTEWHTGIVLIALANEHCGVAAGKARERAQTPAPVRAKPPERSTTNDDPKLLAIPGSAWINKPAEKANTKVAA